MVPRCCSPVPTREDRGSRARDCSFQFVSKGSVFYRSDVRLGGSDPFGASVIDFRMQVSEIVILLGRKSCCTIRGAGHLAMRRAVAKRIAFENFMAPAETETLFSPAEAWGMPVSGRDLRTNVRIADHRHFQTLPHGEERFVTPWACWTRAGW